MKKIIEISEGVTATLEDQGNLFNNVLKALTYSGEFSSEAAQAILLGEENIKLHVTIDGNPVRTVGKGHVNFRPAESIAHIWMVSIKKYPKLNGKGEVISCLLQRAKVTLRGQEVTTNRWSHKVNLVVNETPEGLRYFISANNKIFWGGWHVPAALVSTGLKNRDIERYASWMLQQYFVANYGVEQFYPELKYYSIAQGTGISLTETSNPFVVRSLQGKRGAKDILNGIYSPKGEKFLVKSTFGGLGEIRSMNRLVAAMFTVRALRDFDPNFLAKLDDPINVWCGDISGKIREADMVNEFFRIFGVTPKNYDMVFKSKVLTEDLIDVANLDPEDHYPAIEDNVRLVADILRMFKDIKSRRLQAAIKEHLKGHDMNIMEFHDYVDFEYAKIRQENVQIKVPQLAEFEGVVSPEMTCVAPEWTHDLVRWGAEYNICIGSYGRRVLSGDTYCVGFRKPNGTFWGFAEINKAMVLSQLLGKHNHHLDDEPRKAIESYLKDKGVNVSVNYWGAPRGLYDGQGNL
jgi:hypothetical protein